MHKLPRTRWSENSRWRTTAFGQARYLGTSSDFWLNLQTAYDLKIVQREMGQAIEKEVK